MKVLFHSVLLFVTAALVSCGAGSTPNPIQGVSPGGIWRGTDSASGQAITGLVDETGFGEFTGADGAVFQGQVSTSGRLVNSISVDADGYPSSAIGKFPDGSQHGIWTVNGGIQGRQSISAIAKFTTDAGSLTQGTLDLTFDALYNRPSSLATVARPGYLVGGGPGFLDIAADGSISGHEPTIGDYSGNGFATMDDTVSSPRLMIVGLDTQSGGTYSWVDKWCTDAC